MGNLKPGATYIYESPDGGETVYARESGSTQRQLVGYSHKSKHLRESLTDSQLWQDIRIAAMSDEILAHLLDQVKIYYQLKKQS